MIEITGIIGETNRASRTTYTNNSNTIGLVDAVSLREYAELAGIGPNVKYRVVHAEIFDYSKLYEKYNITSSTTNPYVDPPNYQSIIITDAPPFLIGGRTPFGFVNAVNVADWHGPWLDGVFYRQIDGKINSPATTTGITISAPGSIREEYPKAESFFNQSRTSYSDMLYIGLALNLASASGVTESLADAEISYSLVIDVEEISPLEKQLGLQNYMMSRSLFSCPFFAQGVDVALNATYDNYYEISRSGPRPEIMTTSNILGIGQNYLSPEPMDSQATLQSQYRSSKSMVSAGTGEPFGLESTPYLPDWYLENVESDNILQNVRVDVPVIRYNAALTNPNIPIMV